MKNRQKEMTASPKQRLRWHRSFGFRQVMLLACGIVATAVLLLSVFWG